MAMIFSCVGITAMAEGTVVTSPEELQDAFNNASDDGSTEIVLGNDIDLSELFGGDSGEESENVAKIDDVGYDTLDEALAAASEMSGDVTVEIYDKVTLSQSLSGSYSSIKFVGMTDSAEIYLDVQGYITATGKSVAFEKLTLSKSEGGYITNAGFMNVAFGIYDVNEVTYTDCTFSNGAYASSGTNTFKNCTFYKSYDKYGLWAYGNVDVVVEGCTFADYRGIKMYAEGAAKTVDLTVKNTDFSAVTDKPAIVLTYGESVTLEDNTYSSTGAFELDLDGAPNGTPVISDKPEEITCVNDNGACGVLVDGKIYTTVAQAAEVATAGSEVTLLHNSTETVEFAEGVTLDKNGFTADDVTVNASQPPELPTATVTKHYENKDLAFALNFKADEVTAEQLAYYGDWYADFELKINKEVVFNANGDADGYLTGQYDEWSKNWVNVPFENVTVKANEPLKIMEYASELMGKPGLKYTYAEVYEFVNDFNCGVFFEEDFLEANPDLKVTLELRMYNPKNESESYAIGDLREFVADDFKIPELPTATVTKHYENKDLAFALNFKADEVTAEQLAYYGDWYADFELKINKEVVFNANGGADGYLTGQYDEWSKNWVNVPFENVTVKANEPLKIMEYASELMGKPGLKYTYAEVYEFVNDFNCGVFFEEDFLAANQDLEVTLELHMYNPENEDESYAIGDSQIFSAEDFVIEYVASIGEKKYTSLQDAIDAANAGDTITLLENLQIESDLVNAAKGYFNIAADDVITIDLNGKTIDVTDNSTGNFIVFYNYGDLTIKNGTVNVTSTIDRDWNAQSTVILNRGGNLTVESGTYNHNGGTDMAITLDDSGNSFGDANMTINDGTITSTYTAIRMRMAKTSLNGTPGNGLVYLTVNGGTISGAKRGIWGQITNASADALGNLTVTGGTISGVNNAIIMDADDSQNIEVSISGTASIEGVISGDTADYEITGGTFSVKPNDAYAAEGFEFTANAEGKYEVTEKEEVELFDIYAANVTLGNSLAMNFAINKTNITGTDYYAEIKHYAESEVKTIKVDFADWTIDSTGKYYVVTYSGLTAKQIIDDLDVTIYRNDDTQVSNVWEDGLKAYAVRMMKKTLDKASLTEKDNKLLIVLADMLNYGAAAQREFSYKVDTLATDCVDEKYMVYASEMPEISDVSERDKTKCFGSTLSLKDRIILKAAFSGVTEDMYATVSFTKHNSDEELVKTVAYSEMEKSGSYVIIYADDLVIADANQVVTITIYNEDGTVYTVFKDSMNSYIKRNIDDGDASKILEMTAKFTDSAYKTLH